MDGDLWKDRPGLDPGPIIDVGEVKNMPLHNPAYDTGPAMDSRLSLEASFSFHPFLGEGVSFKAMSSITVLTTVYVNAPERLDYFKSTIDSFYRCMKFPGDIIHYVMDDRSPMHSAEVKAICDNKGLTYIHSSSIKRTCFHDVFKELCDRVETEYCLYLEGDHYFYLPYDFVTPALTLFHLEPGLQQLYLRAPIVYEPFRRVGDDLLVSHDGSVLRAVRIDNENVGWVGRGVGNPSGNHESFSLMPSIFPISTLRQKVCQHKTILGGPGELEGAISEDWDNQYLTGYLNAQAFCYHIGNVGKNGPGSFLEIGDSAYESVWSQKILPHFL